MFVGPFCLDYLQISYFWIVWPFQLQEPLAETLIAPSRMSVNTFKLTNQVRQSRSCLGEFQELYKVPIWRDPVTISVKYMILKVQSITFLPIDLKAAICFICAVPRLPEDLVTWVNILGALASPALIPSTKLWLNKKCDFHTYNISLITVATPTI